MLRPNFEYSNLPVRPGGQFVATLGRVMPGVASVQAQVVPYAQAWESANQQALTRDGPLWVVLGDSMAQGVGASRYDRGWPGQLAQRLDPALRMVNLSTYGARVCDVLERQLPTLAELPDPPVLVTLVAGSNDVVRRRYRRGLPAAFGELLSRLPTGAVVANLPNPNSAAREVDRLIRAAAASGRIQRVDTRDRRMRSWRGRLAADHFHPNDAGYAAMAEVILDAVPSALRRW